MLDCAWNIGIDVDNDALEQASENFMNHDLQVDLLQANIKTLLDKKECVKRLKADTVIMNPPFGTRYTIIFRQLYTP
jgi:predicted RNA methylase